MAAGAGSPKRADDILSVGSLLWGVERKSSSVLLLSAVVDLVLTVAAGPSSLMRPQPGHGTRSGRSDAATAVGWAISGCAFDGEDMTEATAAVTRLSGARGVAAPLTGWLFDELCDTVTGYCTGVEAPETHGGETGLAGEAGIEAQEYQRRAVTVTKPPCVCGAECLGRRPPEMACGELCTISGTDAACACQP